MAAHAVHHPRSGRFVKAYLLTWGLLATGALTYLGSLAWQPEFLATPPARTQVAAAEPEPDPALRTANKALAEIGTVQRNVGEIQRDVRQLKESVEQQEAEGKIVRSRLASLEERTTAPEVPVAAAAPNANQKARKVDVAKAHVKTVEPRQQPTSRVVTTIEGPKPGNEAEAAPIETGSIAQMPITFGDAVVTTAPQSVVTTSVMAPPAAATAPSRYAVQLGAGPSLDALRLTWSLLAERHGAALASLQPHFVAPRNTGGPYRLVAGPLPSKAEADSVCKEMGVGRNGCFSTTFVGEPL